MQLKNRKNKYKILPRQRAIPNILKDLRNLFKYNNEILPKDINSKFREDK